MRIQLGVIKFCNFKNKNAPQKITTDKHDNVPSDSVIDMESQLVVGSISGGLLSFSSSFTVAFVATVGGCSIGTTEAGRNHVLQIVAASICIQILLISWKQIRWKQWIGASQSRRSSEEAMRKFRQRIDLNLSRAENAMNMIRYALTFDLPQDVILCLNYCIDVLKSNLEELHIPQVLLQLPTLTEKAGVDFSADVDESVKIWLRSQFTRKKSSFTMQQAVQVRFDCIKIEDLGCSVQDWLVSQFSRSTFTVSQLDAQERRRSFSSIVGDAGEDAGRGMSEEEAMAAAATAYRAANSTSIADRRRRSSLFADRPPGSTRPARRLSLAGTEPATELPDAWLPSSERAGHPAGPSRNRPVGGFRRRPRRERQVRGQARARGGG